MGKPKKPQDCHAAEKARIISLIGGDKKLPPKEFAKLVREYGINLIEAAMRENPKK